MTPLVFHTGGKLPPCLTTSMFMDSLPPLPQGPGSHAHFYFLLGKEKKKSFGGMSDSMGDLKKKKKKNDPDIQEHGKFSRICSF